MNTIEKRITTANNNTNDTHCKFKSFITELLKCVFGICFIGTLVFFDILILKAVKEVYNNLPILTVVVVVTLLLNVFPIAHVSDKLDNW